jgi:hypothetical protein
MRELYVHCAKDFADPKNGGGGKMMSTVLLGIRYWDDQPQTTSFRQKAAQSPVSKVT